MNETDNLMETATTAGAGGLITTPLWLHTDLSTLGLLMGIAWIAMQMYYKVKNERRKDRK